MRRVALLLSALLAACTVAGCTLGGPRPAAPPKVGPASGTVMPVGGGAVPPEVWRAFIDAAGGPDAELVVIPTAGEDSVYPADWGGTLPLKRAGARRVTVLHAPSRALAESDSFARILQRARGVWFPGGRQWRLVDAYLGTRTERELRALLERGGVVAGSSAGASILASYLVRGARAGNTILMAPGYEQGFGYLRSTAVDQHVSARDRQNDLGRIRARYPRLLGVGLDEGTALLVRGDVGTVIGRGVAYVHGGRDPNTPGRDYRVLQPGTMYDLAARRVVRQPVGPNPGPGAGGGDPLSAFVDSVLAPFSAPGAPGAAVLVAREGQVLLRRGVGLADVSNGVPVTTQTNFRLASLTKAFTATVVLSLVRDGRVELDAPVTRYLRGFNAYGDRVTVRMLLHHTSGLHDYEDFVPDTSSRQVTDVDVERILARLDSTDFVPGSRFAYSNSGYALLARIAEQASGQPFRELVARRIAAPAGLAFTLAYQDGINAVRFRAFGHSRAVAGGGAAPTTVAPTTVAPTTWRRTDQSPWSAVLGDGGIYSSVDDLHRWLRALDTDAVLDSTRRALLFTSGVLGPRAPEGDAITAGRLTGYGMGWYLDQWRGVRRQRHTGSTLGFRNAIVRFPDQDAHVIVLTNRGDANAQQLADTIAARLFFGTGDARWVSGSVLPTPVAANPPPASPAPSSPPPPSFRSVSAPSESVAWAGGSRGTVLRSLDGGLSWERRPVAGADRLDFRGIAAVDASTALAMSAGPGEEGQARLYKTSDGGATWRLVFSDSTKGAFLDALQCWDARHCVAFGDPVDGRFYILRTTDGGERWQRVPNTPAALTGEAAFAASNSPLAVHGDRFAWIATGGGPRARVLRSDDRGATWTVHDTPVPGGPSAGLFAIAFVDEMRGLALGGDYRIAIGTTDVAIATGDGGRSWHPVLGPRPDGLTTGLTVVRGTQTLLSVGPLGSATWSLAPATPTGGRSTTVARPPGFVFTRSDTIPAFAVAAPSARKSINVGPRLTLRATR